MLLTVDALLHPRADTPHSDFPVPAVDPASWVADIGIGAVSAEQDGVPDAPRVLPRLPDGQPDLDGYYQMSAPDADLVGDVDGFNVFNAMLAGASLSATLVSCYVDGDPTRGPVQRPVRLRRVRRVLQCPGSAPVAARSDFVARFFQTILDQLALETDRFD